MQTNAANRIQGKPAIPSGITDRFKAALLYWIIAMNVAFMAVELPLFRQLIKLLNAVLLTILLFSGNTIKNWVIEEFAQKKQIIKRHFHKHSSGIIHLSFDFWTSSNQLSLVGVVIHYMDDIYTIRIKLLGLKRLRESHLGKNLAQVIIKLINEYEIADRLGFFVLNNASSNDICVNKFLTNLYPHIPSRNYKKRRLRCWGHVFNLVAKAFLYKANPAAFKAEIISTRELDLLEEKLNAWRRKGPIGKLYNNVVFIRRTP
jgi:hypothetical protein